jgi:hypothetical protein
MEQTSPSKEAASASMAGIAPTQSAAVPGTAGIDLLDNLAEQEHQEDPAPLKMVCHADLKEGTLQLYVGVCFSTSLMSIFTGGMP